MCRGRGREFGVVRMWRRTTRCGGEAYNDEVESVAPIEAIYRELQKIAAIHLRRAVRSPSLQTTQLVHEAWMRMKDGEYRSQTHFLALASRAMRMVLVDAIRAKHAAKREGNLERLELTPEIDFSALRLSLPVEQILDLDQALVELAARDERKAQVVEMRFFGGMELTEIGETLGVSLATVKRDWEFARAWLFARLRPEASGNSPDASLPAS